MLTSLVIGDGISAKIVAERLLHHKFDVALLRHGPKNVFEGVSDGFSGDFRNYLESLDMKLGRVCDLGDRNLVSVGREKLGFSVRFDSGEVRNFASIFLALETAADNPVGMQRVVKTFEYEYKAQPENVLFVLDLQEAADPNASAYVLKSAAANCRSGGNSWVLCKNVPVNTNRGEVIYDEARDAGVSFYRYAEDLPEIESSGKEGDHRYKIRLKDPYNDDLENEIAVDSIYAPASSAVDLETHEWIASIFGAEPNQSGKYLSENVHNWSGNSRVSGLYIVGPAAGDSSAVAILKKANLAVIHAATQYGVDAPQKVESLKALLDCARCLTCIRVCPQGAIILRAETAKSHVEVSASACSECGICISECPNVALDSNTLPMSAFKDLIVAISSKPGSRVVFGCRRSSEKIANSIEHKNDTIFFPVTCAGRISESLLWSTFAAGADRILVLGCHDGNCVSGGGTQMAKKRVDALNEELKKSNLEAVSLEFRSVAPNEPARLRKMLEEFCS